MANLLKTDLKRIIKDKLFLVICILGVVFALITPSLYRLLFIDVDTSDGTSIGDLFSLFITARGIYYSSFNPTSNFGILLPVFIAIIIFKDFNQGTIRNKIISGHSRFKIFLSIFLSSFIVITGVILAHGLLTLLYSSILFDYGTTINSQEILYFVYSLIFIILTYACIAALVSFLCVLMRSTGLTILLYIASSLLISAIPSILTVSIELLKWEEGTEKTIKILRFFVDINIFYNLSSVVGNANVYNGKQIAYILITTILFISVFFTLGALKFRKKDIK